MLQNIDYGYSLEPPWQGRGGGRGVEGGIGVCLQMTSALFLDRYLPTVMMTTGSS